MASLEPGVVVDDVVHCRSGRSLAYRLTDQIEVVALRSGHHSINDCAGKRVLFVTAEESGADPTGDYDVGQWGILVSPVQDLPDLSQLKVVDMLDHSLGYAVAIYHYLLRQSLTIVEVISFQSL